MRNLVPWLVANTLQSRQLPEHCTPTTPFLQNISSTFNTCLPTPLALASTLVGTLSIFSWLFAQFPQIVRNYQNKSVAGLSVYFLAEWLLGDLSNLLGALFTNQATWQVIIGGYYCFVDVLLVGQWIWYERLQHGRPLKRIWLSRRGAKNKHTAEAPPDQRPLLGEMTTSQQESLQEGNEITIIRRTSTEPQDIPTSKSSLASDMFRIPVYGTVTPSSSLACSPANRNIHRIQQQSFTGASPKTVLMVTMLIALAARATPLPSQQLHATEIPEDSKAFLAGTILSWCSTVLYLLSRLPQLILNARRKSTSGLSPTLFAAAFCGNFFYSTSLLLNPNAWYDYGPYGGHGWAGEGGNNRADWVKSALPFFLGAAGVLGLDGTVGVQFVLYGGNEEEEVVVMGRENGEGREKVRVRRVSGWMRGWLPVPGGSGGGILPVVHGKRRRSEHL